MKKLLSSILLVSLSSALFAAPYTIYDEFSDPQLMPLRKFVTGNIVNKTGIPFRLYNFEKGEKNLLDEQDSPVKITETYQNWFKNLKNRIEEEKRTEFDFMKDIIDFGASDKVAFPSEKSILNVHITRNGEPAYSSAQGDCIIYKNRTDIFVRDDVSLSPQHIILHEIGHSMGIGDSYNGAPSISDMAYSTESRPGVMNQSSELTCDDADALASIIYLYLRNTNPKTPDFKFKSFCKKDDGSDVEIINGRQSERKTSVSLNEGKYYITDFCKNGEIKSYIEINPAEAWPINEQILKKCQSVPSEEITFPQIDAKGCEYVDLTKNKNSKITPKEGTVVCEQAYMLNRKITFNNVVSKVMVEVRDNDNNLFYVYAILNDGRAFAYSPTNNITVLYDTKDYKKYSILRNADIYGLEANPDVSEVVNKVKNFLNDKSRYLNAVYHDPATKTANYLFQAVSWQNYLKEHYPQEDLKMKSLKISPKDLEEMGKKINASFK